MTSKTLLWHDGSHRARAVAQALSDGMSEAELHGDTLPDVTAQTHRLILLVDPQTCLTDAMADGLTPPEALARWQSQTRALLSVQRAARRRCHVFFAQCLTERPEVAATHLSITPETLRKALAAQQPASEPAPFLRLLAVHSLGTETEAIALLAELRAASPLPDGDDAGKIEAAFAAWKIEQDQMQKRDRALEQAQQSNEDLGRTRDMLQKQNKAMIEDMVALEQQLRQFEQRTHQLSEGLAASEVQLAALRKADTLKAEKLRVKNHQIDQLAHEHSQLRNDIERIWQSRSFRLTAPLRALGRIVRGRGDG